MLPVFQPPGVVHIHYPKCQLTAELDLQHYMNMVLFCISWPLLDLSFSISISYVFGLCVSEANYHD